MIFIYAPNATPSECLTNGYGHIDVIKCPVYEEVNGAFKCNISIPVESTNSEYFVREAIIKCPTHRGVQLFRLTTPVITMDEISAVGWHITYDMANDIIMSGDFAAKTGVQALPLILAAGSYETRFTGTSDISTLNNLLIVRGSLLGALMNTEDDNCFLTKWGGEIERDNFVFNIPQTIGADNGLRVAYRKNLTGMTITEDDSKATTRIIPTCIDEDDSILGLTEVYINSTHIADYPLPKIRTIHYSDIKVGKEVDGSVEYPTQASARAEMQARVASIYATGIDLPRVTVDINFVLLGDTAEYAEYTDLESANLGDVVKGGYRDITFNHRIVAVNYDAVSDKLESVILGAVKSNFASSMYAQDINISALNDKLSTAVMQGERYNEVYIDHTDGFVAECASLNSKSVLNGSKIGFYDMDTDEFIGGLASVDGLVALIARILADKEDPDFYATIGERLDGSVYWRGIYGYYWGETPDLEEDKYYPTYALECMEIGEDLGETNRMSHIVLAFQEDRKFYYDLVKNQWIGMHTGEGGEGTYGGIMLTNYEDSPHGFIEVESGSDIFLIGADEDGPYVNYRIGGGANKRTTIPGMQFGTKSIGSAAWSSVSFPMAYPTGGNYKVFVTPVTGTAGVIAVKIRSESNTGFDMTVGGTGFSNIPVNWMAVYYP